MKDPYSYSPSFPPWYKTTTRFNQKESFNFYLYSLFIALFASYNYQSTALGLSIIEKSRQIRKSQRENAFNAF